MACLVSVSILCFPIFIFYYTINILFALCFVFKDLYMGKKNENNNQLFLVFPMQMKT